MTRATDPRRALPFEASVERKGSHLDDVERDVELERIGEAIDIDQALRRDVAELRPAEQTSNLTNWVRRKGPSRFTAWTCTRPPGDGA